MLLMTNIDNLPCDQIPLLIDRLLEEGASNVHVVPALTKKGRPETIFLIDVKEEQLEQVSRLMAAEAGTLGLRRLLSEHISFRYEMRRVQLRVYDERGQLLGRRDVVVKVVLDKDGGILSARAECDDVKDAVAYFRNLQQEYSFPELKSRAENEVLKESRQSRLQVKLVTEEPDAGY